MLSRDERAGREAALRAIVAVHGENPRGWPASIERAVESIRADLAADAEKRDERTAKRQEKRTAQGGTWYTDSDDS